MISLIRAILAPRHTRSAGTQAADRVAASVRRETLDRMAYLERENVRLQAEAKRDALELMRANFERLMQECFVRDEARQCWVCSDLDLALKRIDRIGF